jgi:magnesium transporter
MLSFNDIKNLLQHNKITDFVKLNKLTPRDIANFANRHTQSAVKLIQHLDPKHAARAFKFMRRKKQEDLLKALPEEKAAELLNAMQPDDRTAFLEELPGTYVKELLKILTPENRAETLELLGYEEGSVGRLMTPDYLAIKEDQTCQEVLAQIRQRGQATETLNWLFVLDEKGVLIDDINIKDFLIVDPGTRVSRIMDRQFLALNVNDSEKNAINIFRNHSGMPSR